MITTNRGGENMKFKLEFDMNNAAFWSPEIETERILRKIASDVAIGWVSGTIADINGNVIGRWEIDIEIE